MKFMDLFRPKWRHSNPRIRLGAIEKLSDQAILAVIAKNDSDPIVRKAAQGKAERLIEVTNLTDQTTLEDIAKNDSDATVRLAAIEKLTISSCSLKSNDSAIWTHVPENPVLADIAKNDKDSVVRAAASKKLTPYQLINEREIAALVDVLVNECAWYYANADKYPSPIEEADRREREILHPIGERLHRGGGIKLMRRVYNEVEAITLKKYGKGCRGALDMRWNGVGDWLG